MDKKRLHDTVDSMKADLLNYIEADRLSQKYALAAAAALLEQDVQQYATQLDALTHTQTETTSGNLLWMLAEIQNWPDDLPIDKAHRCLAFVQGVMAMAGLLSVTEERNATRPIFHEMYRQMGIVTPRSRNREPRDV